MCRAAIGFPAAFRILISLALNWYFWEKPETIDRNAVMREGRTSWMKKNAVTPALRMEGGAGRVVECRKTSSHQPYARKVALFMQQNWLLGQFEDLTKIPIHANHGWRGLLHRCQVYPWITACTRGPCHPSHGQKSTTGALVPCMDGDGSWIKVRIYILKEKELGNQS